MHRTPNPEAGAARVRTSREPENTVERSQNNNIASNRYCTTTWPAARRVYGQKKARYGSGLNLSLEENRGDRFIMLHRKKEIQFRFVMSAIGFINDTAIHGSIGSLLVHQGKCSTIAKCLKTPCCRSRFFEFIHPRGRGPCARRPACARAARWHCRLHPAMMGPHSPAIP
jgi:hypothetical protein